jgi:hypothetical protein
VARHQVVREGAHRDVGHDGEVLLRDDRQLVAPFVRGVDLAGAFRRGDADRALADLLDAQHFSGRGIECGERVRASVEALDGPDRSVHARQGALSLTRSDGGDDRGDRGTEADQQREQRNLAHGGSPLR